MVSLVDPPIISQERETSTPAADTSVPTSDPLAEVARYVQSIAEEVWRHFGGYELIWDEPLRKSERERLQSLLIV